MCPEVEKWYSPVPRNPKMVQSNAEKLKILRTIRPEVQKRYSRGQSRFSSEAMLWKCQAGYAGGVGQSGFRRGALATWDSRNSFLRRCCGNARQGALATWAGPDSGGAHWQRGSVEVQFGAMLWKCRAGYAGGVAVRIQAGRTGMGQSKFISEAMLWKCRTGCTGNVGQSGFRRGALATWVSRDSVLRRCCRDDSWSIRFRSSGHSHCRTHCPNDSGHPTDAGSSGVCRTERS